MHGNGFSESKHLVELHCPCCQALVRVLPREVRLQATFCCPHCCQETRFESSHLLESLHQIEAMLAQCQAR